VTAEPASTFKKKGVPLEGSPPQQQLSEENIKNISGAGTPVATGKETSGQTWKMPRDALKW